MNEVINLRRVRKQKARAEAHRLADANRAQFGRSKNERKLAETEKQKTTRHLDAHKLGEAPSPARPQTGND